jgi:hypothetical protein
MIESWLSNDRVPASPACHTHPATARGGEAVDQDSSSRPRSRSRREWVRGRSWNPSQDEWRGSQDTV